MRSAAGAPTSADTAARSAKIPSTFWSAPVSRRCGESLSAFVEANEPAGSHHQALLTLLTVHPRPDRHFRNQSEHQEYPDASERGGERTHRTISPCIPSCIPDF